MRSHDAFAIVRAAGLAALLGASGCFATVEGEADYEADVPVVEVGPPVVEVYSYPHYYYRGETVYLVEGHWYARRGPHWVQYRTEPTELSRHRVVYERSHPRRVYRR